MKNYTLVSIVGWFIAMLSLEFVLPTSYDRDSRYYVVMIWLLMIELLIALIFDIYNFIKK